MDNFSDLVQVRGFQILLLNVLKSFLGEPEKYWDFTGYIKTWTEFLIFFLTLTAFVDLVDFGLVHLRNGFVASLSKLRISLVEAFKLQRKGTPPGAFPPTLAAKLEVSEDDLSPSKQETGKPSDYSTQQSDDDDDLFSDLPIALSLEAEGQNDAFPKDEPSNAQLVCATSASDTKSTKIENNTSSITDGNADDDSDNSTSGDDTIAVSDVCVKELESMYNEMVEEIRRNLEAVLEHRLHRRGFSSVLHPHLQFSVRLTITPKAAHGSHEGAPFSVRKINQLSQPADA
ncbi:MAG: hypothetical protein M1819_001769 [Sarea resinae]|nr:MAG: hypothetical protein M1819_001769 [Sarea resinae]